LSKYEIETFEGEVAECDDPVELGRKVMLAFRRLPSDAALAFFARLMTAELAHPLKVAVWDAVRYSHIWWSVDDVLKGEIMNNPLIQQAFADAVPMRHWVVDKKCLGWQNVCMTLEPDAIAAQGFAQSDFHKLLYLITHAADEEAADFIRNRVAGDAVKDYVDSRGNGILWYLTYRDDQSARGGFACPCIECELLRLGVDPCHRNNLGLCWNDVARHVIRR
jgi:hypothetical protein